LFVAPQATDLLKLPQLKMLLPFSKKYFILFVSGAKSKTHIN